MPLFEGAMAIFLSTFINKVDRKGRVSVPASFRSELESENDYALVAFPSLQVKALECCSQSWLKEFNANLERMDIPSEDKEVMATAIFGSSISLNLDSEGRVLLPQEMLEFAGLSSQAAFFGCGSTFQIWEPSSLKQRTTEAREKARAKNISLRMITLDGQRTKRTIGEE